MSFIRHSWYRRKSPPNKWHGLPGAWKSLAALGMTALFLCAHPAVQAPKITERAKQKRAAETERADLQQKLDNLKRDINRTETAKSYATDALAHSEAAISQANRALRELAQEQSQTEARLAQLSKKHIELTQTVDIQQKQLAGLLREQYVAGNEDRIKLLLSGDNPNRINRDLQYMGYVSQAQAKLLESLRTNLLAVETNKAETQNAKDELDEIALEARQQKVVLEKEKAQRATLLSQLSSRLAGQRKEAGNIQRDEQRLGGLVERLAKLIEEQQKAEAAAQEKRRQEQLARAQREKQRAQAKNDTKGNIRNPNAIDDDVAPAKTLARNELAPEAGVQDGGLTRAFRSLRGQLRLPVKGELIAKFGSKRGDGPSWKGLFIRVAEGAEVKAVAGGRVVFAEWLRGFGNLIIIDHGSQYMTIYGNNQAVLKRAGDAVNTGDIIANAGNSGGNEQSGLYFEMRHQGRAFDPLEWVTLR
jgi:septal ring factor EnvC (AmiA/AmiB activator)